MTTTPEKPREFAIVGQGSIFDGIAYWVTLAGIYLMVGGLMFYSGKEKLFDEDGNAPLLASLVRLEILPHRDKSLLQVSLAVAMLTFACLAFGQTVTRQFEGTASLYTYFASTVMILILVSLLPPNRPDRWLGGGGMR